MIMTTESSRYRPKYDPHYDANVAASELRQMGQALLTASLDGENPPQPAAVDDLLSATSDMLLYTLGWIEDRRKAPTHKEGLVDAIDQFEEGIQLFLAKAAPTPIQRPDLPEIADTISESALALELISMHSKD